MKWSPSQQETNYQKSQVFYKNSFMTLIPYSLYLVVISFIFNAFPQLIIIYTKKPLSWVLVLFDHHLMLLNFANVSIIRGQLLLGPTSSSLDKWLPPGYWASSTFSFSTSYETQNNIMHISRCWINPKGLKGKHEVNLDTKKILYWKQVCISKDCFFVNKCSENSSKDIEYKT